MKMTLVSRCKMDMVFALAMILEKIGGRLVAGQRALRAGAHFQRRMPHQLKSVLMQRCVEVLAKGDQRHLLDGDRLVFNLHQVGSCSLKLQGLQRGLCLKQLVFSPANIHFTQGAAYYLWSTWAWKTTCKHITHTHTQKKYAHVHADAHTFDLHFEIYTYLHMHIAYAAYSVETLGQLEFTHKQSK